MLRKSSPEGIAGLRVHSTRIGTLIRDGQALSVRGAFFSPEAVRDIFGRPLSGRIRASVAARDARR